MTDEISNTSELEGESGDRYYTETVVEVVDNRRQRVVLIIILVIALLALLALAFMVFRLNRGTNAPNKQSMPKGISWVRSIYGWSNSPADALSAPTDVAVGPSGTIWVVSGHDTIAGFNPDGTARQIIKPKGVASLEGIAVDEKGNLFVTDFGGQVFEYSPKGKQLDQWRVQLPNEIDVRDGKIAVAAANGVAVFTPDGKIIAKWGSRGTGNDQFDLPHGILLGDDGTIFVSDTQNRRVRAFTPQGRLMWSTGITPDRTKQGAGDFRNPKNMAGPFSLPAGMAFDGKGRIAVVDPFKFRIALLDPKSGKIAREPGKNGKQGRQAFYGDFGQTDGMFAYPTGVAYDKTRDWFVVADTANDRVQIIRLPYTGGSVTSKAIGAFSTPCCVFCAPLLLLLVLLVLAVLRRRAQREAEAQSGEETNA
ncbi:MAG TPA: NHL repeat-containing protein [Coriobacteriia bacterium]|nr:NHL repeat-containing protein [Coriobacteriia bacterium]